MAGTQSKEKVPSLAALEEASPPALRAWFEARFGIDPGPHSSQAVLRGNLSWALQVDSRGQDPGRVRKALKRALEKALSGRAAQRPKFRAGTQLVREWQGEVYSVTVLEAGYEWRGRKYKSLSQIATEITGVKWSGPRFFGLERANR